MTTLHVREDAAARRRRRVPLGRRSASRRRLPAQADASRCVEHAAGRRLESGAGRVPATGDGLVLRGLTVSGLPTLLVRTAAAGRARDRPQDARRARRRGRRARRVARSHPASLVGSDGPHAATAQRPGPRLRLAVPTPLASGRRPSACSPIRAPRAPPTSTCACPNGWPQAGSDRSSPTPSRRRRLTLKLQLRVAQLSTRS